MSPTSTTTFSLYVKAMYNVLEHCQVSILSVCVCVFLWHGTSIDPRYISFAVLEY